MDRYAGYRAPDAETRLQALVPGAEPEVQKCELVPIPER